MTTLSTRILGALFTLCAITAAYAQDAAPAPDGRAALEAAMDYAVAQEALAFNLKVTSAVDVDGKTNTGELSLEVLLQGDKNGRIRSYTKDDEALIYTDGTERYVHLVKADKYVKGPAPKDRRELLGMAGAGPLRMVTSWLGEFITKHQELLAKLESVEVLADGHLKLAYPNYDAELVLGTANQPLPQRIVWDFTKSLNQQKSPIQKMVLTADFSEWNTAPEIAADTFAWRPPAGMEVYTPQRPAAGSAGGPTLGALAPQFSLDTHDGGTVALADHKDKDIVLLDFFASWCGPCRVAMPVVHEVAAEYAGKGVKLYAVNLREPKDKIEKFLTSNKLEGLSILMDTKGQVASDYGAASIPRMVVIGKDGTVQAIHAGYHPDLKQKLKENIDTLLKGEKLAQAPGA